MSLGIARRSSLVSRVNRESAMASGERDVEMADADEFDMRGEAEGDEFADAGETAAAETESYEEAAEAFHPGSLEAQVKDVVNEYEERELKQDKAMKDLITDVIGITSKEMFGEYALREWENLTPSDWAAIRRGEEDEKRSAFPFKFMMKAGKNKASRMLSEIEKSLGDGKGTVMMIIKSSASARGMYEIDPKNIGEGKGKATAAFRVYKAYLTLRAIVSSQSAWREENVPLIAQVMRHLFKGKSALYGADSHRKMKQAFKCDERERPVDLPLTLNPSPLGRGNRELRHWGGKLSAIGKEKADRIWRVDHVISKEGEDPEFPIKAFEEWMHLRPMAGAGEEVRE